MKHMLLTVLFAAHALVATAACPSWPTAERFVSSGAEVTDQRTGLVWARCSVGQSWDGSTCNGSASTFIQEGALAHAQAQSGWRLPNVKELASLADKGCANPAIDSTAFPSTPSGWYWSSSPTVGTSSRAWNVDFGNGNVNDNDRVNPYAVRLVRANQ